MRRLSSKRKAADRPNKSFSGGVSEDLASWLESGKGMIDCVPVPLWIEDFSLVKLGIDSLKESGVVNLRRHLNRYPKELLRLAEMVRILWVNNSALNLFGTASLSDFSSYVVRVSGKRSYEAFKGQVNAFAEGKTEFSGESIAVTPRGQKKHILLQVRVDPSHKDDLSRVFIAATDITGIKRVEEELRKSEQIYRQVFESAMLPMAILDARSGIIVDSNGSLQRFVGFSSEALMGKHVMQLCVEGERKRCTTLLSRLGEGTEASAVETLRLCHSGGREISAMVSGSAVRCEDAAYVFLIFSSTEASLGVLNRRAVGDRRGQLAMRAKLTERERVILTLISTGHSNKLIGEQLGISRKTVESHRLRIMQKLDVHKATDLVRYVLTSGILVSD